MCLTHVLTVCWTRCVPDAAKPTPTRRTGGAAARTRRVPLCLSSPLGPGGFLSPFPRASRNCLPLLVEVNVVRPRVPPPRPAGVVVEPLRALHIDLSSTAEAPAAT